MFKKKVYSFNQTIRKFTYYSKPASQDKRDALEMYYFVKLNK